MTRLGSQPAPRLLRGASVIALAAAALLATHADAADSRFWTLTPYKVRVRLAVQSRRTPTPLVAERVAQRIIERADASIGALWDLSVEPLSGGERLEALRGLSGEQLLAIAQDEDNRCDKLITLAIRETPSGYTTEAVECDSLLEMVSEPIRSPAAPLRAAGDAAFAVLVDVFSPLALFEVDRGRNNDGTARLTFRGAALPRRPGQPNWAEPGRVLLPVLRRTDREGAVVEDGIRAAPWTYFVLADTKAEPASEASDADEATAAESEPPAEEPEAADQRQVVARVYSHSQQPFGARRRGRVEQYALLLPRVDVTTRVKLSIKEQPDTPLAGYDIYAQDGDEDKRVLAGASGEDGTLEILPGSAPIQTVFIKSGSQVVAKAPVPVGLVRQVEIGLLDERARLDAEAKLALLREELIDLIATRNILAARIRNAIAAKDRDEARRLLEELEGKKGQSQLSRDLNQIRQRARSDNPTVQARIDKQFSDTAIVVGAFLGPDLINELRRELAGGG